MSRKNKRKEQQAIENLRSKKLLKTVLAPLLILLAIPGLIFGVHLIKQAPKKTIKESQTTQLVIKEKKYAEVSSWSELIEALSNKQISEIYLKKDIKFPQSEAELAKENRITVQKEKILHFDKTKKQQLHRPILLLNFLETDSNRYVVIQGEGREIDLGKVELNLPAGLELDFNEVVVLRAYHY
ncbi:pectate lyase-like adhesive domain-containing protein [Enterococcus wangshanyuanii]|uniref:Uncharacterized protein n=1 Tax=Enterococcus wangshanyuanii TaxID=2005703 RepID=A0ABQ1NL77_9ENTE|nr:pectate lyase-like adhesive domain-containing protein [Enterococcus wangshanyuanii]GGC79996.1 hypothetical protein GCM10011573_07090 [Enterococcus wangshanyuanii]